MTLRLQETILIFLLIYIMEIFVLKLSGSRVPFYIATYVGSYSIVYREAHPYILPYWSAPLYFVSGVRANSVLSYALILIGAMP